VTSVVPASAARDDDLVVSLRGLHAPAAALATTAALHGLTLDIRRGEQIALIGSSGAGKTSLLQSLSCAVTPLSGSIELFGTNPWALSSRERQRLRGRLFLAPQVPPLPPRQRVVSAVLAGRLPSQSLAASVRSLWHPREAPLAHAALVALDMGDKLWDRVDRLSGGERQRVGLARALVADAELWLIDEPLSALDPARATQVIEQLTEAARRSNRTLVCTLHQVEVARRCFGRIVALRAGVIVYDGAAADFTDAQVAALYGSREALEIQANGSTPQDVDPSQAGDGARPLVPLICR
jgi:phosphonate transport system ATP-binding protein